MKSIRLPGNLIAAAVILATAVFGHHAMAQTPAPVTPPPQQPSSTMLTPASDPIGNVAALTGSATITRFGATKPLKVDDDIYMGDGLQTTSNSTLGITFNDATTFNLSANSKITVDKYVYEANGKSNNALFRVVNGTVAFVASEVAKTGDMKIETPSATLGIRGTTGLIEVPDNAAGGGDVAIKLYPDADGRVGHIEVNDRSGARLGLLSQGASGFSIRPGPMGFTATRLVISPQQALRDQGFVRQVHAAQITGRQVIARQRELRLRNPARQPGQTPQIRNQPRQQQKPQTPNGRKTEPGQRRSEQPNVPGAKRSITTRAPDLQSPPAVRSPSLPRQQRATPAQRRLPVLRQKEKKERSRP